MKLLVRTSDIKRVYFDVTEESLLLRAFTQEFTAIYDVIVKFKEEEEPREILVDKYTKIYEDLKDALMDSEVEFVEIVK